MSTETGSETGSRLVPLLAGVVAALGVATAFSLVSGAAAGTALQGQYWAALLASMAESAVARSSGSAVDTAASSVYLLTAVGMVGHLLREFDPKVPDPSEDLF